MKIKTKLQIIFFVIISFLMMAFGFPQSFVQEMIFSRQMEGSIAEVENDFNNFLEVDTEKLVVALELFSKIQDPKEKFIAKDKQDLLNFSLPIFEELKKKHKISHFYYHSKEGINFLRVHNPEISGDEVNRITFKEAEESRDVGKGLELGKTAYALRAVMPYFLNNELIGYIEFGEEIDHIIKKLKHEDSEDLMMVVKKDHLSEKDWKSVREVAGLRNNWNDLGEMVIIDSTIDDNSDNYEIANRCVKTIESQNGTLFEDGNFLEQYKKEDRTYVCGAFPVIDAGETQAGLILYINEETNQRRLFSQIGLGFLGSIVVFFTIAIFVYNYLIKKIVVKPIEKLRKGTEIIEKGNLDYKVATDSKDEIGELSRSFDKMTKALIKEKRDVEEKIEKRTAELKKVNKFMVGREIKMIELKKRIQKLEEKNDNTK